MSRISLIILMFCASAFCTPSKMRVGTYAINKYTANGYKNDSTNLSYSIVGADLFWKGSNITTYCGTVNTRTINKTDTAVTYAAISRPANGKCDFFYFAGHGLFMTFANRPPTPNTYDYGLGLGKGTKFGPYGGLFSDQYPNGGNGTSTTEYTRWMYLDCCSALRSSNWSTRWTPVFKGLQVVLGYNSESWEGSDFSPYMLTDFWQEWTGKTTTGAAYTPNSGIWAAHVHSVSKWIYNRGGCAIAPACIEAYVSGFQGPCYNTYAQANSYAYYPWWQLKYHWVCYGAPTYDGPGNP